MAVTLSKLTGAISSLCKSSTCDRVHGIVSTSTMEQWRKKLEPCQVPMDHNTAVGRDHSANSAIAMVTWSCGSLLNMRTPQNIAYRTHRSQTYTQGHQLDFNKRGKVTFKENRFNLYYSSVPFQKQSYMQQKNN